MLNKLLKRFSQIFLLTILSFALSSCFLTTLILAQTNQQGSYINGERVKSKNYASPAENTLAFFTLKKKEGLFGEPDVTAYLIQVDPRGKHYKLKGGYLPEGLVVFAPIPPNADMQTYLTTWVTGGGNMKTYHSQYYPLCSTPDITMRFKTKKPGLQYLGEYKLEDGNYVYISSNEELDTLQKLRPHLKGSEWEKLVEKRIQELGGKIK